MFTIQHCIPNTLLLFHLNTYIQYQFKCQTKHKSEYKLIKQRKSDLCCNAGRALYNTNDETFGCRIAK